jgi:hypothetical protein
LLYINIFLLNCIVIPLLLLLLIIVIAIVITSTSSTASHHYHKCYHQHDHYQHQTFLPLCIAIFKSWVCRPSLHLPYYLVSSLSAANMCRCSAPVISHHYLAFLVALSCPLILKNV